MAILNSIRKKTAILILIIALALFAFVLSDLINTSGFSSDKVIQDIGKVGDITIDRAEFARNVDATTRQSQGRLTTIQAVKQVWDRKVEELALEEEYEILGIEANRNQIINILSESLAGNPNFSNDEGFFDEGVMTEYLADLKVTKPQQYQQWNNYEKQIANIARKKIYLNLIKAGVGTTLIEAEQEYKFQNDNVNFQAVYIPFSKAKNIEVSSSEVKSYISKHPDQFKQDAQRDIQYVYFEEVASQKDIDESEKNITNLMDDFKSTDDLESFINLNSDKPYNASFRFEYQLPKNQKAKLLALKVGEVTSPEKIQGNWKATKLEETKKMPDSAQVSHILIPLQGPDVNRSPEESRNLADSLLSIIKTNPSKMADLAKQFSSDTQSAKKGGDLGWSSYGRFVESFNEAVFNNQPGYKDVVETRFGYHVINVKNISNKSTMYKLVDLTINVKPSEETLNEVYRNAGNFLLDAKEGNFEEVAKAKGYEVKPVLGIKSLEESIPGLGAQRQIVNWAFKKETSAGDIEQFDLDKGYAVVQLNKITPEGQESVQQASAKVTPIIEKEKKAQAILEQISSNNLQDIASQFDVNVQTVSAVNMANPLIPGAGEEPKVVGVAFGLNKNEVSQPIIGEKGVFVIKLIDRNAAPALATYKDKALQSTQKLIQDLESPNNKVVKAIIASKEVEDNRTKVY